MTTTTAPSTTMRWIATLTNFFLPGLGHLISGYKRLVGIGWMLGMIGLTYVELGIKASNPTMYWIMFGSVFLVNTMFAIDTYKGLGHPEARAATA